MAPLGCTHHMSNNRELFENYQSNEYNKSSVEVGNGASLPIVGRGEISVTLSLPHNKKKKCRLTNVLYVPGLSHNLLSISQITSEKNLSVNFFQNSCKIANKSGKLVASGKKLGKLFVLECVEGHGAANIASHAEHDEILWHRRFCHIGFDNLRKIIKNDLVDGIDVKITKEKYACENCYDGKNHKIPFYPNKSESNRNPISLIHSDICGPIKPESLGGGNYFITFIDDATRFCWIYILKHKSEAFETFKKFKLMVENQFNSKIHALRTVVKQKSDTFDTSKKFMSMGENQLSSKIHALRTDGGGEYCSNAFETFLENCGIIHEKTIVKTPEQNGVSERKSCSLVEMIRCMISDSNLPKTFWAEALNTANYVMNRCPTVALNGITPYEALYNRKPNVKYFRAFGSSAYVHIPKDERSKLDPKTKKCILVGYGTATKGYRVYDPVKNKVIHARNIIFNENFKSPDHA